ncbi:hypothetical protein QYM36_008222, partial [Artemia franciscana]
SANNSFIQSIELTSSTYLDFVNGLDVSEASQEKALQIFQDATEPILIEVYRRPNAKWVSSSRPGTSQTFTGGYPATSKDQASATDYTILKDCKTALPTNSNLNYLYEKQRLQQGQEVLATNGYTAEITDNTITYELYDVSASCHIAIHEIRSFAAVQMQIYLSDRFNNPLQGLDLEERRLHIVKGEWNF